MAGLVTEPELLAFIIRLSAGILQVYSFVSPGRYCDWHVAASNPIFVLFQFLAGSDRQLEYLALRLHKHELINQAADVLSIRFQSCTYRLAFYLHVQHIISPVKIRKQCALGFITLVRLEMQRLETSLTHFTFTQQS